MFKRDESGDESSNDKNSSKETSLLVNLKVLIPILIGYFLGSLIGTYVYRSVSHHAFLIPAIFVFTMGLVSSLVAVLLKNRRMKERNEKFQMIPPSSGRRYSTVNIE